MEGLDYYIAEGAAVAELRHGSYRRSCAAGLMIGAYCSIRSAIVRTSNRSESYLPYLSDPSGVSDLICLVNSFRVSILCCGIFKSSIQRIKMPRACISTLLKGWRFFVSS